MMVFTIGFVISVALVTFILGGFCGAGMVFVGILGAVEGEINDDDR